MTKLISALANLLRRTMSSAKQATTEPFVCPRPEPSVSSDGIHYVDDKGLEQRIEWRDIREVCWSEPDYGYGMFGSPSDWIVRGDGVTIRIEDESSFGTSDSDIAQWFAKKLPGFDATVVESAFKTGRLGIKPPPGAILKCWSAGMPNGELQATCEVPAPER